MAAPEFPGGELYTPGEELDVFINWGNELTRQHPDVARTIIESLVERTVFPPQLPIPAALLDLDPDFAPHPRQK